MTLKSWAAWRLGAHAQQLERMRRIGVLIGAIETDPESQARIAAFKEGLQALGWTDGRNVHIDYRFGSADLDLTHKYAAELVAATGGGIVKNER